MPAAARRALARALLRWPLPRCAGAPLRRHAAGRAAAAAAMAATSGSTPAGRTRRRPSRRSPSTAGCPADGAAPRASAPALARLRRPSSCRRAPWAAGSGRVSCVPSMLRTDTAPSARRRSITCCTSTSGADAPAVRPTRRLPSNHSALQVVGASRPCRPRCPGARRARAGGCCWSWSGCRRRSHVDLRAQHLDRVLAVLRGVADVLLLGLAHVRKARASPRRGSRPHRRPTAWSA